MTTTTNWTPAIEILETASNEVNAVVLFASLNIQQGVQAARILRPTPQKPEWRVQAIMETNGEYPNGWLPDGMKHVMWRGYF